MMKVKNYIESCKRERKKEGRERSKRKKEQSERKKEVKKEWRRKEVVLAVTEKWLVLNRYE